MFLLALWALFEIINILKKNVCMHLQSLSEKAACLAVVTDERTSQ